MVCGLSTAGAGAGAAAAGAAGAGAAGSSSSGVSAADGVLGRTNSVSCDVKPESRDTTLARRSGGCAPAGGGAAWLNERGRGAA